VKKKMKKDEVFPSKCNISITKEIEKS